MGKSLNEIQNELKSVIKNMNEIITDLYRFQGIGQEVCIRKLNQFIDDCETAIQRIETVKQRRKEALEKEEREKQRKLEEQRRLQELENNKSSIC